jgi:hypothetical protein
MAIFFIEQAERKINAGKMRKRKEKQDFFISFFSKKISLIIHDFALTVCRLIKKTVFMKSERRESLRAEPAHVHGLDWFSKI